MNEYQTIKAKFKGAPRQYVTANTKSEARDGFLDQIVEGTDVLIKFIDVNGSEPYLQVCYNALEQGIHYMYQEAAWIAPWMVSEMPMMQNAPNRRSFFDQLIDAFSPGASERWNKRIELAMQRSTYGAHLSDERWYDKLAIYREAFNFAQVIEERGANVYFLKKGAENLMTHEEIDNLDQCYKREAVPNGFEANNRLRWLNVRDKI